MSEGRKRLRDEVRLGILFEDETPFGSALGGRADETVKGACAAIVEHRGRHGMARTVGCSRELLGEAFAGELAGLYAGRGTLREECLFPPADRVRPAALSVSGDGAGAANIAIGREGLRELAPWVSQFQQGTSRPVAAPGRALFDALDACGALTTDPAQADLPPEGDVTFVGHASVMVDRGARVLIDPFLFPPAARYPDAYQPYRIPDLLPADAVLITHSHPDHFDPGTLLRLGADLPIYVPEVERESLLALDMAARLEQMGFTDVRRVRPGAEVRIAGIVVQVLPLFGEQPTTGDVLHPEVRNVGCTYLCESGGRRTLFLADSGRDRNGDVRDLAGAIRRQYGDVDAVFGGYRGFALYPIHYLFSSVARFLLFVPEGERAVRQKIMNDGDGLIDTAERCGARFVVPYAAGGAPWYWERGLGCPPRGSAEPAIDRPPEHVVDLSAARSMSSDGPIPSPVRVLLLRPGDVLRLDDGVAGIDHGRRQVWPYDPPGWIQMNVAPSRVDGSIESSVRRVFRALEKRLDVWRRDRGLACFFFMRKSPGLRLRFRAGGALDADVSAWLEGLAGEGAVESWFRSVYEPETERFGGVAAMDAVHAWFDVDASQFLRLDRLRSEGSGFLAPDRFCRAVAADLVTAAVADRAEAWAVWKLYAASLGPVPGQGPPDPPPGDADDPSSRANPDERAMLSTYCSANRELARKLASIRQQGQFTAGIRSVLAAVILFHGHRHGLDLAAHGRIASAMIRALDPALPHGV